MPPGPVGPPAPPGAFGQPVPPGPASPPAPPHHTQTFAPQPTPTYPPPAYPAPAHPALTYAPPGEQAYDRTYPPPAYGEPGFDPAPYDAATEVFDRGPLTADPYADAQTGLIPMPAPVDSGARDGFAPQSGGFAPQSGGYGSPSTGFGSPADGFGPSPAEPQPSPPGPGEWGPPGEDHHETPLFSRLRRIRSHAMQRPSRRWVVVVLVIALVGAAAGLRFWPGSPWYHGPREAGPVATPMPLQSTEITAAGLGVEGFLSWAYEDLRDGSVVGSANLTETTEVGPLLTAWFGADLLRRAAETGQEPAETELADIEAMIRDKDVAAADRVVAALGDVGASLDRLRTMCHLTNLTPAAESWRNTTISAQDAARLGGCLADGRAAGAQWTPWLLNVMRQVRDGGGIREAFPPGTRTMIAVANGVMLDQEDGQWRANCLAVSEIWALAVLRRFPASADPNADIANIEVVCQRVAQELTSAG